MTGGYGGTVPYVPVHLPTDSPGVSLRFHRRGDDVEVEVDGAPGEPTDEMVEAATDALVKLIDAQPEGVHVHLAADHPASSLDPLPERIADSAGLRSRRDLYEMRRPLPVEFDHPARSSAPAISVRAFAPGRDDEAWIEVNNLAFADHPDQGRENPETLADRTSEPWFDPEGFLLLDEPAGDGETGGGLAGFCWTKVHHPTNADPELGEIYVIGVHPRHHGQGLGVALVLAGLDHLAGKGIPVSNLYVDADNAAALKLYDRLGFEVHQRRRVYGS